MLPTEFGEKHFQHLQKFLNTPPGTQSRSSPAGHFTLLGAESVQQKVFGTDKEAKAMSDKAFRSVRGLIEDDPAQAANMKYRSALMMAISEHIKAKGLNQTEAALLFAVSQPRISDLM